MSIFGNLFLWAFIVWLPAFLCWQIKNETKPKKDIVVGVTLPKDATDDEEVAAVLEQLRKRENIIMWFFTLSVIPCVLITNFDYVITIYCLWCLAVAVVPSIPYAMANKALKTIKKQRGWKKESGRTVVIDTNEIWEPKIISPLMFLVPFIISFVPVLLDRESLYFILIDSFTIVIFYICYRYLYRYRNERASSNPGLNETLSRIRYRRWGVIWICSSWFMALLNFVIVLMPEYPTLSIVVITLMTVILVAIVFLSEANTRRLQEKLTAGEEMIEDDDDHWIWGIFYYNENDQKTIISNRTGINTTVNLATPVGKIVTGVSVLILLSIPLIWPLTSSIIDKAPMLEYTGEVVKAGKYEIALEDIEEISVLDELPNRLSRTAGTGLPNLLKGRFRCEFASRIYLSLDPTVSPFILIKTYNDEYYLFGTRNSEDTMSVFAAITAR